jgi:hypothetical protein
MSAIVQVLPIPATSERQCVALDAKREPMGYFKIRAGECLVQSTEGRKGWFWSYTLMRRVGRRYFPTAAYYQFDPFENRKLAGIGKRWDGDQEQVQDS